MKEREFIEFVSKIEPHASMDQRITNRLLNYDATHDNFNQKTKILGQLLVSRINKLSPSLPKVVAVLFVLAIIGSTTALAAGYYIKSYSSQFSVISEPELKLPKDLVKRHFGGHTTKSTTTMENGKLVTIGPETYNDEDVNSGDKAFGELGLPNLFPTYLYNNYIVDDSGIIYGEEEISDGSKSTYIAANFTSFDSKKLIYVEYVPSKVSKKDSPNSLATDDFAKEDFTSSQYITENGLICNLIEAVTDDTISATIYFDSNSIGNATYLISFSHVKMNEVKEVLDSIPISVNENNK